MQLPRVEVQHGELRVAWEARLQPLDPPAVAIAAFERAGRRPESGSAWPRHRRAPTAAPARRSRSPHRTGCRDRARTPGRCELRPSPDSQRPACGRPRWRWENPWPRATGPRRPYRRRSSARRWASSGRARPTGRLRFQAHSRLISPRPRSALLSFLPLPAHDNKKGPGEGAPEPGRSAHYGRGHPRAGQRGPAVIGFNLGARLTLRRRP